MTRSLTIPGLALLILLAGGFGAYAVFEGDAQNPFTAAGPGVNADDDTEEAGGHDPALLEVEKDSPAVNFGDGKSEAAPGAPPPVESMVTGNVTATAGVLPAALSVTATPKDGEPFDIELDGDTFEIAARTTLTLRAEADAWYQVEPVTAEPGDKVVLRLSPAALLNGRVDGTDGSVLAGAQVRLVRDGKTVAESITDAGGRYTFRSLRPSAYRAEVSYGDNTAVASLFVILGDNHEDLVVDTGTTLRLSFVDENGRAVIPDADSVSLKLGHRPTEALPYASPEPNEFAWTGLRTATYTLDVMVPAYEHKREYLRMTSDGLVKQIKLKQGGAIHGEVVFTREVHSAPVRIRVRHKEHGTARWAELDDDWRFELGSLALGEYIVEAMGIGTTRVVAETEVEVTGLAASVQLKVDPGCTLRIQLTGADGEALAVPGFVKIHSGEEYHWATIDEHGRADLPLLEAGKWNVALTPKDDHPPLFTSIDVNDDGSISPITIGEPNCLHIQWVRADSPAAGCGLKQNDLLVAFQGEAVSDLQSLSGRLAVIEEGTAISMRVIRDGEELELHIPAWPGGKLGISAQAAYHE